MYKTIKDVSRVRHCFLGRTCFSVGRTENRLHGRKKKKRKLNRVLIQISNARKNNRNANGIFHRQQH